MSIISGIVALGIDKIDGYDYSQSWIEYWNAFACFGMSLLTGLVLSRLKESLDEQKKTNAILSDALDKLSASTAEIRKLQSGLQTVCAWTQRIKVGDEWMTPEQFLKTQLHLELTHGISPQALQDIKRDALAAGHAA